MGAFRLNGSNVVAETIDGEVLAIRSDTGSYFSMIGPAATAWSALLQGADLAAIAAAVAAHHSVSDAAEVAAVREELEGFAEALAAEELLVIAEPVVVASIELPPETAAVPWSPPVFEKYTDMQDLLLFDPIHEVSPAGWPSVATPLA
jgi:hypothetical protein